ncbi:hypothetical protein HH214_04310 [Mucilaginibacter robiniae]|uniref:Uncharacterized protein n=1 Tax=Mucilaginibacter robiniae TaxID=2728022 RepID=A0A7L5E469_9SPHI|nr:hypothetical protein [Mucilaginibacter robiniae]QJD95156.1 hypothetical protein HH214_04310 [Mucilaginibacter robiniae]
MQSLQLYLNDQLVDLSDDSLIALSFQINNLAEVKNQQGNTSNQFKLPLTQNNRQILGYPDDVAFTNCLPYTQYAAKLVQDGLEIIPYGIGELNSIDQDTASVTILSGNVDFFDSIDGKLYDVGDTTSTLWYNANWKNKYEHEWSLQNVMQSQTKLDGWIWPIVDYGKIDANFSDTPTIDVRHLRPGFFLKTAIEMMVQPTGYTINPSSFLVNECLYKKLIVQFANDSFEHSAEYLASAGSNNVSVKKSSNQVVGNSRTDRTGIIQFDNVVSDMGKRYSNVPNSSYSNPAKAKTAIQVNVSAVLVVNTIGKWHDPATISIHIVRYDPVKNEDTHLVTHNLTFDDTATKVSGNAYYQRFENVKISGDVDLAAGQSVKMWYELDDKKTTTATIEAGSTFTITVKNTNEVQYGDLVQCERIFPDIGQKDLLKDTLQRFGIICQTDNTTRTVTLASLRDIVNHIPLARDWTSKCLNQGKTISFQLGGYAQVNNLKYKQDDNVLPQTFADAQILVKDKTLAASADLFESQFAPTLNRPYIGGTIAQILKVDTSTDVNASDFSINTQPRILIHDTVDLLKLNRNVKFTDGTTSQVYNDTLCTPYFDKTGGAYSLLFDKLRLTYYPELEKVLQRSKKVVRYFLLTPRDILELNLLIPVYLQQDSAYYYINKIDSWRKGQPTKVELVKLG